jgi:hypothetical protein
MVQVVVVVGWCPVQSATVNHSCRLFEQCVNVPCIKSHARIGRCIEHHDAHSLQPLLRTSQKTEGP